MQVEIKIDSTCKEPRIIVLTDKLTDEINALVKRISEESPQILSGFWNRLTSSAFMHQPVKSSPQQPKATICFACDCMNWRIGLTETNLSEYLTLKLSISEK